MADGGGDVLRNGFEMGAAELCGRYFDALHQGDLDAIAALFTPEATVVSPLYGAMNAVDYHRTLMGDTDRTRPELRGVFDHANNGCGAAAHFSVAWTLTDHETVEFEAVNLFELACDGRFRKLTVVYDAQPVREAWSASRERQLNQAVAAIVTGGSSPAA